MDLNDYGTLIRRGPVALLIGMYVLYYAFNNYKELTKMSNLPFSKIRSISKGIVKVKGKLIKKSSDREKNHDKYEFKKSFIPKKYKNPVISINWVVARGLPFNSSRVTLINEFYEDLYLDDGSGKIYLDLANSFVLNTKPVNIRFFGLGKLDENDKKLLSLEKHIKPKFVLPFYRKVQHYVFEEGDEVEIVGFAERNDSENKIILKPCEEQELFISNSDIKKRDPILGKGSLIYSFSFGMLCIVIGLFLLTFTLLKDVNNYYVIPAVVGGFIIYFFLLYRILYKI